ncbi:MAG: cupredoxin domain-containing protein [Gammaproteobacteria bacterium]|nr:cupredoxin domain-containing protein [Gammaproteobacteria bacterium]
MSFSRIATYFFIATVSLAPSVSFAQIIKVTLLDNAIQLDTNTVKAGKVTFEVTNASTTKVLHEMVVLKTSVAEDKLPVKNDRVPERKFKSMGEVSDLATDKSQKLTAKLAAGHYVLICNNPGHYQMGMHTTLTATN